MRKVIILKYLGYEMASRHFPYVLVPTTITKLSRDSILSAGTVNTMFCFCNDLPGCRIMCIDNPTNFSRVLLGGNLREPTVGCFIEVEAFLYQSAGVTAGCAVCSVSADKNHTLLYYLCLIDHIWHLAFGQELCSIRCRLGIFDLLREMHC